jgi:hypothetical protein
MGDGVVDLKVGGKVYGRIVVEAKNSKLTKKDWESEAKGSKENRGATGFIGFCKHMQDMPNNSKIMILDPQTIVIQFNPERVQHIRIAAFDGMADAKVEGHKVELRDVQRGASICIDLRSRVLDEQSPGQWRLRAGPLMRRYLDGYLPMQAQLQVQWPEGLLKVATQEPINQDGAQLNARSDGATWQLTFAGRLNTHMVLQRP